MMPAANQGVGMNMGFPDVCMTPVGPAPVPIPYPNIGMNAMSMPFIPNVLVSMAPAQNMGAKPTMTNGDNAGVAHPMVMMPGGTTMGNPRILMGGMPASHLTVPTYGNNFNNPVGAKLVPSVTNVLLGDAALLADDGGATALRLLLAQSGSARRNGEVLELRLPQLGFATARWLAATLRRHATAPSMLLDLRGNPGGPVDVAQRCAALLSASQRPLAILIDRHTASSAELLASLLCRHADARLFGERSFGKDRAAWFAVGDGKLAALGGDGALPFGRRGLRADEVCHGDDAAAAAAAWLAARPGSRS
ncbi:MAG: DUF4150 domain-containing protein [Planctomycetes bacterium]|nr:DUF4150 domain-containing protein [Planctomycetota bacterium]